MADYQDFADDSRVAGLALANLRAFAGELDDRDVSDVAAAVGIAVALGFEALATAVAAVGTRIDYVLRDLNKHGALDRRSL